MGVCLTATMQILSIGFYRSCGSGYYRTMIRNLSYFILGVISLLSSLVCAFDLIQSAVIHLVDGVLFVHTLLGLRNCYCHTGCGES